MVISNSKYGKKQGSVKNRAYMSGLDETLASPVDDGSVEFNELFIPRYEEIKFLDTSGLT
jgi:hypothetical protein